jgi:hypothetical protein
MAGITLAQAEEQLGLWLAASTAVSSKQSYRIGERQLTHADAGEILKMIEFWDKRAAALGATAEGRGRLRTIVPAG